MRRRAFLQALAGGVCLCGLSRAAEAAPSFQSGPQPGDRPLPFTSNMVTGPQRGKQHCYI